MDKAERAMEGIANKVQHNFCQLRRIFRVILAMEKDTNLEEDQKSLSDFEIRYGIISEQRKAATRPRLPVNSWWLAFNSIQEWFKTVLVITDMMVALVDDVERCEDNGLATAEKMLEGRKEIIMAKESSFKDDFNQENNKGKEEKQG